MDSIAGPGFNSATRPVNVLLAEESAGIRRRLAGALHSCPAVRQVRECSTVPQALAVLQSTPPDLIVLDLGLPGGRGMEVLRAARSLSPPVRVVVLTYQAAPFFRSKALAAGAEAYFDKALQLPEFFAWLGHTP